MLAPGFEGHPWIVAVALRCLCDLKLDAWGDVKPYNLLGSLHQLVVSERMEQHTQLAPLAVKALRSLLLLFLRRPELVDVEPEEVSEQVEEPMELPEPLEVEERAEEAKTLRGPKDLILGIRHLFYYEDELKLWL